MAKSTEGDKKTLFLPFSNTEKERSVLVFSNIREPGYRWWKKKKKKRNQQREERRGDFEEWRCPVLYPLSDAARQPSVFMCRSARRRRRRSSARKQRRRKKDDEEGEKKDKRVELTRWEANKQTNESCERWRRSAGRYLDRSVFPETQRVRCQSGGKHPLFKSRAERLSDCV